MTAERPFRIVSPTLTAPIVWAAVSVLIGGLLVIITDTIGAPVGWTTDMIPVVHMVPPIFLSGSVICAIALRIPGVTPIIRRRWMMAVAISLIVGAWLTVVHGRDLRPPTAAFPNPMISEVTGICRDDLRPSSVESRAIAMELTEVRTATGWRGSAHGRVHLVWSGPEYLATAGVGGTRVPIRGDTITAAAAVPDAEHSVIWADGSEIRVEPASGLLPTIRRDARLFVRRRLARLPQDTYTVALALLLGTRAEMSPELIAGVRGAGASHVIALSGMHLGVLAFLLSKTFSRIAAPRVRYGVLAAALLGYVWVAGWIPSLVRALILAWIVLLARGRDRCVPPEIVLGRCVVITAVVAPGMIWALGFQLSLWALVGLFFLSPWMVERLSNIMPPPVAGYVGVTLGPLVATAPISLLVFGTVYPVGVLSAGILALMAVVLMWGSLAFMVLASVPVVGSVMVHVLSGVTGTFVSLSTAFAAVPGIDVTHGNGLISVAGWCTLLIATVGGGCYAGRHRQRALHQFLESHGKPQFDF